MINGKCGNSSLVYVSREKGRRESQEDYYGIIAEDNRVLFAIADGMGGHSRGELASRWMVEELVKAFHENKKPADIFKCGVEKAVSRMKSFEIEMGCTFTAVVIQQVHEKFKLSYSWLGDSRLYLLSSITNTDMPPKAKEITRVKNRGFWLLTEDDSLVWGFLQKGELTLDQLTHHPDKGYLERSVHTKGENLPGTAERRTKTIDIDAGDRIFLCTDGIWGIYSRQADIIAHLTGKKPMLKLQRHLKKSKQEGALEDDGTFIYAEVQAGIFDAGCFPRDMNSNHNRHEGSSS